MRGENNDSTDFAIDTVTERVGSVKAFRLLVPGHGRFRSA